MDMTVAGIVLFILLIAGLFALTFRLARYGRGRRAEVDAISRETALRDVSSSWRGVAGFPPTGDIPDRSPRDRLRSTDDEL